MSVLKDKRLPSKAEYVNTANEIYIETMAFLPRLSARYSRLMAGFPAKLAAEVVEYTEKANKIFPQRRAAEAAAQGAPASSAVLPVCA